MDRFPVNVVEASSRKVHRVATGLLVLMAAFYAVSRSLESRHPAWGFLRAFSEAGMVGALADWFAVVALFRHPLGMSWIPHTAIIAKRKDQIADSLARFVEENFLGPAQIAERLSRMKIAEKASAWLANAANAKIVAAKLRGALPGILEAFDDTDMKRFLRENLLSWAEKVPLAPISAKLLGILSETGRHQELLEQALQFSKTLLDSNVEIVEHRIEEELRRVPKVFGLKTIFVKHTARKIVDNIQTSLDEILSDPHHQLRGQFHEKILDLVRELDESPEWRLRAEAVKREVLSNEALVGSLDTIWGGVKRKLAADFSKEESTFEVKLAAGLQEIGLSLMKDEAFREKLDGWVREAAESFVTSHGHEVGNLIRETVHKWDGEELSAKLEKQVGSDLQYIRINGTLVGGLVGIILHTLGWLIWG